MKPVNIVVIVGALTVAGLGAWYMYMQSSPQYQKSAQRGLDPVLFPEKDPEAATGAPAAPSSGAPATAAPTP